MKSRSYQPAVLLALLLTAAVPGCLEIKVTTTVHSDGSCDRTVSVNPNDQKLPHSAFPIPSDSSWTTGWKKLKDNDGNLYTATKRFENGGALAREYDSTPGDPRNMRITPRLEKQFRWFFTYFSYKETYHVFNPFTLIPASQLLSGDEIRRIAGGEKNDTLKNKLEEWEFRNLFERFHGSLLEGARRLGDPSLTTETVTARKEELFQAMVKDTSLAGKFDPTMQMMTRFFRTQSILALRPQLQSAWDAAEAMLTTAQSAEAEYSNSVTMPGLILDTNAGEVKGTTVVWKFSAKQFLLCDYVMWVESREMNLWAIVLTGIAAVILLGTVVVLSMRRQRMP